MKRLLLFGAPVFQIPIIQKAKEMGLWVGVIDINSDAPAVSYADEYFCSSLHDKERLLEIAKDFMPDGIVIGACDTSVVSASYVCQQLGLPGHTMETAICATDKLKMLEAFERKNVPHPKYLLLKRENVDSFSMTIPYPAISKPVNSSGSRGIAYIADGSMLRQAVERSFHAAPDGMILIEEYMTGPEVSVEVLVVNGKPYVLQITDKQTSGPPHFFETGHMQPSSLPAQIREQIARVAEQAVIAVGIQNSPAHVEIKVTPTGPKLVELGARFGGDCISTYLLDTSISGLSFTEAAIQQALGIVPDCSRFQPSGNAACVQFLCSNHGIITSIQGVDTAQEIEDVVAIMVYGKVGHHYNETTENADRIGYVVGKGKSPAQAKDVCERALRCIQVHYSE